MATTPAAASATPRPASSAPDGPLLEGRATAALILPFVWFGEKPAEVWNADPPAALLQEVGGDCRGEGRGRDQHDGQDPAVPEYRESQRPQQGSCRVEDVTGLPRV